MHARRDDVSEYEISFELPTPDLIQYLEDRLYEFNSSTTNVMDGAGMGLCVRDRKGEIVAAAAGHTWGGTCEIRQLWVHPRLRSAGLGGRLMQAAEAIAVERGCVQLVVATHSFQAPGFYEKLGFEELFRLNDYPRGHAHLILRKILGPRSAE
jgi:ribosomal protein S18 acetylase RimI-like enzyme